MLLPSFALLPLEILIKNPPKAQRIIKTLEIHGEKMPDPYFWMRNRDDPKVIQYLKAENAYTTAVMKSTEGLQDKLFREMVSRIQETDQSLPERVGEYYYYDRTEKGKQYKIYCRKRNSLCNPEEIILDENLLAAGKVFFLLGSLEVSPNHCLMAYSTDTSGNEKYALQVKDLHSGKLYPDVIPETSGEIVWANDNRTLFYVKTDEANRPYKVFRHRLGENFQNDALLFKEDNEKFSARIDKTKNDAFVLIHLESNTSSEIHILDANKPEGDFRVFSPRKENLEYSLENNHDSFFIVTNENAKNFKVMEAPVKSFSKDNWKEFIPHDPAVKIDGIDAFEKFLVIFERKGGLQHFRYFSFAERKFNDIDFSESAYGCWEGENREFKADFFRFHYSSLITPESIFDFNFESGVRELKKRINVLGDYYPASFTSERIFAQAYDGTKVPVSLVHLKSLKKDGNNPLYLTAYGSYGDSNDPTFSSIRLSLLERGFIFAIAHIRGGGEMGRQWYEEGKLMHKKNTFSDFISAAEFLIEEKYTSSSRLVICGRSAGGLLMGAVLTMRPDLFGLVIAGVPFVDVINTMLDSSIPLTAGEFEEWGNPKEREAFHYMKSYSPYDNVKSQNYPPLLILAGLNDSRVQYWEPAKFAAKLRSNKTDSNPLLLKTTMGTGHFGASGRYDSLKEDAFEFAFIFKILGITK
ncbi:S9 family peptidase [bacterium]|nr:S9 family peptidase [bacterium]